MLDGKARQLSPANQPNPADDSHAEAYSIAAVRAPSRARKRRGARAEPRAETPRVVLLGEECDALSRC
jgi:hypothetical protein